MTTAQQTSIIELFIALFRTLPAETQIEIKSQVFNTNKTNPRTRPKISLLRGKVSKMASIEIDNQLKTIRSEWQRGI